MFTKNLELGGTESYRDRTATWIGGGSLPCAGFLSITTYANSKVDTNTYACEVVDGDKPYQKSIKVWKLAKMVDSSMPEKIRLAIEKENSRIRPYIVSVKIVPQVDGSKKYECKCSCPASSTCKHSDCIELVLEHNLFGE